MTLSQKTMITRKQRFSSRKMLMAIALAGLGLMTAVAGCESIVSEEPAIAQSQTATIISDAHPLALALEAARADGYVDEGLFKETITITHDGAEVLNDATVVISQEGFLDDSVGGHKFTASLTKDEMGNWTLVDINKEWICRRGVSDSGLCI